MKIYNNVAIVRNVLLVAAFYISASVYYHHAEGWTVMDCLYFLNVTIFTVGFGDLRPTKDSTRLMTILIIVVGMAVILAVIEQMADFLIHCGESFERSIEQQQREYHEQQFPQQHLQREKSTNKCNDGFLISDNSSDIGHSRDGFTYNGSSAINSSRGMRNNRVGGHLFHRKKDGEKYNQRGRRAIFCLVLAICFGSLFYWSKEDFTLIEAVYFTVITTTTVGYGGLTLHHPHSRLFTIFYVPVAVMVVAAAFKSFRKGFLVQQKQLTQQSLLFDIDAITQIEARGSDSRVDKCEFLVSMLVQSGICDKEIDIDPWLKRFADLDKANNGFLDKDAMRRLYREGNERKVREMRRELNDAEEYDHHMSCWWSRAYCCCIGHCFSIRPSLLSLLGITRSSSSSSNSTSSITDDHHMCLDSGGNFDDIVTSKMNITTSTSTVQ